MMKRTIIPKQKKIEFDLRRALEPQTIQRFFQSTPLLRDTWNVLERMDTQIVFKKHWLLYYPYTEKYRDLSTLFFNVYSIRRDITPVHAIGWIYYASLVWCCKRDDYWERFNNTAPKLDYIIRNLHFREDYQWEVVKDRVADLSLLWLATSINRGSFPWKSLTMKHLIHMTEPNLIYYMLIRTRIASLLWVNSHQHYNIIKINEDLDEDLWVDVAELDIKGLKALKMGKKYKKYGV